MAEDVPKCGMILRTNVDGESSWQTAADDIYQLHPTGLTKIIILKFVKQALVQS